MYPQVSEIVFIVPHTKIYEYEGGAQQWYGLDYEGDLYIVKNNSEPLYQLILLNKKKKDQFLEAI
jgi:hypothetical protein